MGDVLLQVNNFCTDMWNSGDSEITSETTIFSPLQNIFILQTHLH